MGDIFVKSDENKKIIYTDAISLYGYSMIEPLPYDKIEMWLGHPDRYKKKFEDYLNPPDDSDIGNFVGVNIKYPNNNKEKEFSVLSRE